MLFLCLQGSRGADERVTLGHCKETGREHLMIAGSGSQLISDIRDKIITGCQSQDQGLSLVPGNIGPSAVCWHLNPALLDNLIWIYKTFSIGEWGIIHTSNTKEIDSVTVGLLASTCTGLYLVFELNNTWIQVSHHMMQWCSYVYISRLSPWFMIHRYSSAHTRPVTAGPAHDSLHLETRRQSLCFISDSAGAEMSGYSECS